MTLAEAVMALGLMTVLATALVGIFVRLLSATAKTSDQAAARIMARGILERALREGPENDWGGLAGNEKLYAHDSLSGTDFVYDLTPTRMNDAGSGVLGNLYQVTVVVTWWRKTPSSTAVEGGIGKVSVDLTGSVYIRK